MEDQYLVHRNNVLASKSADDSRSRAVITIGPLRLSSATYKKTIDEAFDICDRCALGILSSLADQKWRSAGRTAGSIRRMDLQLPGPIQRSRIGRELQLSIVVEVSFATRTATLFRCPRLQVRIWNRVGERSRRWTLSGGRNRRSFRGEAIQGLGPRFGPNPGVSATTQVGLRAKATREPGASPGCDVEAPVFATRCERGA